MYFLYFHILCFLTTYFVHTYSYVLLAANLEDFKSIARKLPKQIKQKIVEIAHRKRQLQNENINEETDISDFSERFIPINREVETYESSKEGIEISDPNAYPMSPLNQDIKRSGSLLTLDEIVKKVKEKLETDLIMKMKSELANVNKNNGVKKNHEVPAEDKVVYEDDEYYTEEEEAAIPIDPAPTTPRLIQQVTVINKPRRKKTVKLIKKHIVRQPEIIEQQPIYTPQTNFATPQAQAVRQNKMARPKVGPKGAFREKSNMKLVKKRLPATTEHQIYYVDEEKTAKQSTIKAGDDGSIFEAVDLQNPNDSYQDYAIPAKDDVYVNDKEESSTPDNIKGNLKFIKRMHASTLPKPETTTAATKANKNVNNPPNEEEYYTESEEVVTEPELHALTGKLTSGEKAPIGPPIQTKEPPSSIPSKRTTKNKRMKFGTMQPTREFFKVSSPNYYGSLPTVAEKYNFDEPIPERDREPENLKQIGEPPKNINGKLKLA